jgi:hypothetical protein
MGSGSHSTPIPHSPNTPVVHNSNAPLTLIRGRGRRRGQARGLRRPLKLPSTRWQCSWSHIRTPGAIVGTELVRSFIELSQVAFSGSVHAQPSWLNVTIEPSVCRQINENSPAPIRCGSTYQLLEFIRRDAKPDPIGTSSSYSVTHHTYFEALLERIAYGKSPCRAAFKEVMS